MSGSIIHHAPAGGKYSSIREAGEKTLATFCDNFPVTQSSFILPILWETNHPENLKSEAEVSAADRPRLQGLERNIHGERAEYELYRVLNSHIRQFPADSILAMLSYRLDNDNGRNLKKKAIQKELPHIDLKDVNTRREHDAIIIVRNIGVVLVEVKTSSSLENLTKGEEQLKSSEEFVRQVYAAYGGQNLPTLKLIILASETSTPTSLPMYNDCRLLYQGDLPNFSVKWSQIISELKKNSSYSPVATVPFQNLVQFSVGVWTMKPIANSSFHFDDTEASLSSKVANIDKAVKEQNYAPSKEAKKFTADIATSMNDVFRGSNEFNVLYLTPEQVDLYHHRRKALIHGHAGTGKSMLIICKIIDIIESDRTQKVILVAPKPHHLRCQKIFEKYNISTDIVNKFPLPLTSSIHPPFQPLDQQFRQAPLPTCNVLIITTQDFFFVSTAQLMTYDVSSFHLLIDDLHAYKLGVLADDSFCTYTDIGNFIDTTYNIRRTKDKYLWVGYDMAQGRADSGNDLLFFGSDGQRRTFKIPIVTMTKILRNTKEITNMVKSARSLQIQHTQLNTNNALQDISCGHHITTGDKVLYEKLITSSRDPRNIQEQFICERLTALLNNLIKTTSQQQQQNYPFGTVAVLFDYDHSFIELEDLQPHRALQQTLRKSFDIGTQSVKDQLLSNNKTKIVVDHCNNHGNNIQSFECATVVYVIGTKTEYHSYDFIYNIISRARTKCVILDFSGTTGQHFPPHDMDLVKYMHHNGEFVKM